MISLSTLVARIWHYRIACLILLFVLGAGIFDDRSIYHILLISAENAELRANIADFEHQYEEDTRALRLMDRSPEAVEKVARVKLFMKKANEDVYIVVDEADN